MVSLIDFFFFFLPAWYFQYCNEAGIKTAEYYSL